MLGSTGAPSRIGRRRSTGQGFLRDVDFDPLALGYPGALRFRRSREPLHRVVAGYERRLAALVLENMALRLTARESDAIMADQKRALSNRAADAADVAAFERTVAEQREQIDALEDRLRFTSDRIAYLTDQLRTALELRRLRDEATAPLEKVAEERLAVIEELKQAVAERTAWAERMVTEVEQRGAVIEELKQAVTERTAWAERMVADAEQRGAIIRELQEVLAERSAREDRPSAEPRSSKA